MAKMSTVSLLIYGINAILIKIPVNFFVGIDKHQQFIWKGTDARIFKTVLIQNKEGGNSLFDSKTYSGATVIKMVQYWSKYRHINQWNRVEN